MQYNVVDFDAIGGLPPVLKMLLEAGLLHGDALTGSEASLLLLLF